MGSTPTAADLLGRACATTACAAGWTALCVAPPGAVYLTSRGGFRCPDGQVFKVELIAACALCLSGGEAEWLFSPSRSRDQVTAALESLAAGQPMACPGLRLQTVPAPRPGQVAAAILAIMDRPGLFEPSRWIDVPSGTADAPGLRREAARADCGIVAGLPGWAAILTVHDQAQLDETDGRRHGRSRFLCRCDDDPGRLHPVELDDLARRALALPAAEARQLSSPYIAVPEIRDALHGIINRDQEETRS